MRKLTYSTSFLSVHKLTEHALSYTYFHLIENWQFKRVHYTFLMNKILQIYELNSTYEKRIRYLIQRTNI
jgi:hypothetical protein